ncbi:MAG: helix-hairpin-helix domain-containing protein [Elusimicrobia bacterium]|nr:helix-hairpin-helix domain-containing protein [Elusimicrobiota bacterium]
MASKLTGWNIEVKSEGQKVEETESRAAGQLAGLGELDGVGPKVAEVLVKAGMADVRKLATLEEADLTTLQGIGEKTAAKIIASAKKWVAEHSAPATEAKLPAQEEQPGEPAPAAKEPEGGEQA